MSLSFISLNSGSNGNCYYVGNDKDAVLIDAGLSCREIEKRLKRSRLDCRKIKAVFISHEHSDHVRGLEVLAKKFSLPVYITKRTLTSSRLNIDVSLLRSFSAHEEIVIDSLAVTPFPKKHDAADPFSFIVSCNGINVGILTDIGSACENVINYFSKCHAALLESNYDEEMLENGNYPYYLRNRIRSEKGHLSNDQALDLFLKHKSEFLSHLMLTHLSKNNNSPEKVKDLFTRNTSGTTISVASRYRESELYHIQAHEYAVSQTNSVQNKPEQLSLFF